MQAEVNSHSQSKIISAEKFSHFLNEGEVGAVLELIVKDPAGKITQRIEKKSESFVQQFLELLWIQVCPIFSRSGGYSVRDTGNNLRAIYNTKYSFNCNAASGETNWGIIVGTGNTVPAITDYKLQTPITHGSSAGQLQYGGVTFGAPASDTTTSQFTITRNFANASGAAITVNEIGLYVKGMIYNTSYYFMMIRDVISGGIAVNNGSTLTVNYRVQAVI